MLNDTLPYSTVLYSALQNPADSMEDHKDLPVYGIQQESPCPTSLVRIGQTETYRPPDPVAGHYSGP